MTIDRIGDTQAGAAGFRATGLLLAALVALVTAGCGNTNLLSSTSGPETAVVSTPAKPKTVAVYPVMAAPDPINKQIQNELAGALDRTKFQPILVTDNSNPPADYQIRGYATASKDKAGGKVAYFFDVLDGSGAKLNRIAGEEQVKVAGKSKDVWPGVTPEIVKTVGTRAAASFTTVAVGPAAPAVAAPAPVAQVAPVAPAATPGSAALTTGSAGPATPPATPVAVAPPSRPSGPMTVSVAPVSGAPGDGDKALTAALKAELKKQGLTVVEGSQATFVVQGKVSSSATDGGNEAVKITWDVNDQSGNRMATVSQGNTVAKGALSGAWGSTATDIAGAASAAIMPIIRKDSAQSAGTPGKQANAATTQVR